jgi:hypothetical protein
VNTRQWPASDRLRQAKQLADELTPGQVRARIEREQDAAHRAAVYRAAELARRAFGGQHG